MRARVTLVLILAITVASALCNAADFSFSGTFTAVNQVQNVTFTVGNGSTVVIRSFGYAGGTNSIGTPIPAGGFDPVVFLFQGAGSMATLIDRNDDELNCLHVARDPINNQCYDTYLLEQGTLLDATTLVGGLDAGTYTVVVSNYANFAVGPTLGDGFTGKGGAFDCFGAPRSVTPGAFLDCDGLVRTGAWAVDIQGVDSAELVAAPSPLSITAENASRAYGDSHPAFTGSIVGVLNGDDITASYASVADSSSPVGTYAIVPTPIDPSHKITNYVLTIHNGVLTVGPSPLSVTVNNTSRVFGAADPIFAGNIAGLKNSDNITASFSTTAVASSPVGTYLITATLVDPDGKLGNYTVANTPGTLTITAPQQLPGSLTFAPQVVGTTSPVQVLTLVNPTAAAMPISISIGGTNVTNFAQTNNCGSSLAVGASCTISVTLTPKAAVNLSAVLIVAGIRNVALSGSGIAGQAVVSPTSLTFAPAPIGVTSAEQAITLSNPGNAPLAIISIAMTGSNPTNFTQTNDCGASLAAGGSCNISVNMKPKAAVALSASVTVTTAIGKRIVPLSGAGIAPQAAVSPTSLTFAPQLVGTASAVQAITLSNPGVGSLSITSIAIAGTNPTNFAQTNDCGTGLAAGTSCTISVTVKPKAAVALSANVTVATAAGNRVVSLSAAGIAPQAVVSPASLTFAPQVVGVTSPAQAITLSNPGNSPLAITSVAITGSNVTNFAQTNDCGTTLAIGASCTINVTMRPKAAVALSASVTVSSSVGNRMVTLSGSGQ